jgi:hypothetical protein
MPKLYGRIKLAHKLKKARIENTIITEKPLSMHAFRIKSETDTPAAPNMSINAKAMSLICDGKS